MKLRAASAADVEATTDSRTSMNNAITITGLPVATIDSGKVDKLPDILQTIGSNFGEIVDLKMPPMEDTSMTGGTAVLNFATEAQAEMAVARMNGHRIDRFHRMVVTLGAF